MEANALHDFTATSEDELSFEKGSIVKVRCSHILKKGPHWHRAEQEGREGLVPNNYVKMLPAPWFSPDVTKDEAERLLHLYPEGGFIMRESQGTSGDFVLSVRFKNGVQHFKVLRDGAGKYFLWVVKFNSLNLLVNYHQKSSISRTEKIFLCLPDMCTAVFDFDGKEANELSFKAGDCIVVLEKSHADWWKGSCNGKVGDFPRTYVKSTEY
ncbi:growth factor receptor-bound protein 2a isoform X1 [Takifugu flavidus]|uniref:growth factor receptor-bound protein 2a isoform X1 n=1 Tax=Takifugu flavidus TaxID=433684 RepID=UPI002544A8F8|nr:growth factor receptor-bound protein 2a isoform X1 [Takifugu flavidus]